MLKAVGSHWIIERSEMLNIKFHKDNSEDGFMPHVQLNGTTVIQARDAGLGGMGSWTYSRDAKGIKSPGPGARREMWGDRGREINISGLGNVRDGRDMLTGR